MHDSSMKFKYHDYSEFEDDGSPEVMPPAFCRTWRILYIEAEVIIYRTFKKCKTTSPNIYH